VSCRHVVGKEPEALRVKPTHDEGLRLIPEEIVALQPHGLVVLQIGVKEDDFVKIASWFARMANDAVAIDLGAARHGEARATTFQTNQSADLCPMVKVKPSGSDSLVARPTL